MSGSSKKKGSGGAKSNPEKREKDLLSIESLLDDIETEENLIADQFSDILDSFDDLDDFDDDIIDVEDLDDLDEPDEPAETSDPEEPDDGFDDLDDDFGTDNDQPAAYNIDDWARVGESDDDTSEDPEESFWDEAGSKPAGLMGSLRNMLQGGKDGKNSMAPLVIIILLAVIIIILLMQNCDCGGNKRQDDWFDTSAIEGTLPGKSPEEIQAMLNQIVEEGMFNISIAPVIVFESPEAQGQARIENIPANHYHMSVKITLDDTSETIYESKGIRPGQYIEYIKLQKALQPGEYAATAMFSAYDADDLSEQGRVAVKITIIVE